MKTATKTKKAPAKKSSKKQTQSYVDFVIEELQTPDGGGLLLTPLQQESLKYAIVNYALAACVDSRIHFEAEDVADQENKGSYRPK